MKSPPPFVAVFSAVDGSGGAGLLADCRAVTAAGGLPLAVTTAITAQNLDGVLACWALPPARVRAQFAAYPAAAIAAVKIGVVGRSAAAIAGCLRRQAPVVWDPVFAPSAGAAFVNADGVGGLRRRLLPAADVVTPNRREALQLGEATRIAAAVKNLFRAGCRRLLITDIDGKGKTVRHALFTREAMQTPLWEMCDDRDDGSYHGSGCLFSSTLATRLARGDEVPAAAAAAHRAVKQAIRHALVLPALGRQRLLGGRV